MNKSNLILASVSAIIFTSILIIFSPNSQKLNFSSSVPSPTSSQSISPTPDPTADWKTYTNTQYLYSLKYPNGWLTRSFGPGLNGLQPLNTSSRGVILSPNNQETTVPSPMFEIQAEGPENLSRPIYSEWEKQIKTNFSNSFKLTKELTSIISGITATILEGEHVYPKTSTYIKQFIFASSEKGVYFTIAISSATKQESLVFDQILSTFKFTDNTAVIPSSITTFYTAVNSYFKSNIAIIPEKQFYSSQGMIDKASWSLDISKVDKEKGLISNVFMNQFNMKTGPGGGDRGGASITEFVNDKLDCYYSTGSNSTGGPETWNYSNSYSNISCTEK